MNLEALERHAAVLASATSPSALFRALLEAAAEAAPRAGVLLQKGGRLRGWGSVGTSAAAAAAFRALDLPTEGAGTPWAAAVEAEGPCPIPPGALAAGADSRAAAGLAVPVRAGGRAVALIVAERLGEGAFSPSALALFGTIASLRLELDLARRRLAAREGGAVPPAEPPAPRPERAPVSAAPEPTGLVPVSPPVERAPGAERRDEARRFARLIATDIRLYNEEAVVLGRRQGDLLRRLQDPLARGREAFVRRFGDLGDDGLRLLHEACVQVLAAGDDALLPYHTLRPTRP